MLTPHWLLNRRHFLRTLGATAALPLVDGNSPVRAADAAPRPDFHWALERDARETGSRLDARAVGGVRFGVEAGQASARLDGRTGHLEIADATAIRLGRDDFTVALWCNAPVTDDPPGDLVSCFDAEGRRGFNLGFQHQAGTCTSTSNTRNLFFGVDDGTEPKWTDCGRPGRAVLPYALAVFEGDLYTGTFEHGADEAGGVFRYAGGTDWIHCGNPDRCNSVHALAVHQGQLFAGVSHYTAAGSHLPLSQNLHPGGRVYRYAGGKKWEDCGRPCDAETLWSMISFGGELLVTSMDAPPKSPPSEQQGLYRYEGGTKWTFLGNPGGRVAALAANDGELFGSGYNGGALGGVFRYDGDAKWTNLGAPPKVDQTYAFAVHRNVLQAATWREAKVFGYPKDQPWRDEGRLGKELEVMGMAVFNGKLYGGTLPLAQVWRRDDAGWTLTGRLDFSDVEYRRAWSMAVFQGRLFCGVLPSGHLHALQAGAAVSFDRAVGEGWRHVAAIREQGRLKVFLDGKQVAQSTDTSAGRMNLDAKAPLRIGMGEHATFNGALRDVRLYRRALASTEVISLAST